MLLSWVLDQMHVDKPYSIENEHDFEILALCVTETDQHSLIFVDGEAHLPSVKQNVTMALTTQALSERLLDMGIGVCVIEQPRILFFLIHNYLCSQSVYTRPIFQTTIGKDCHISPLSCISAENVRIGDRVSIEEFVTVRANTVIGDDVIIRAGSRIGGVGYEFKRNGDEILPVEHAGGVIIGNHVEIQENACIDRAVYPWDNTVIGEFTKIDNLVHIAHAVKTGRCNMIVANSGIGGRVVIGDDCWIGFGTTIVNGITIGDRSRVNMGAVVTKAVPPDTSVSGNFAIEHGKFIQNLKKSLLS